MPTKINLAAYGHVTGHLELRSNSKYFYARVTGQDGSRDTVALRIRVEGQRPTSMSQQGDKKFELSRARASQKLEELQLHLVAGGSLKEWRERYRPSGNGTAPGSSRLEIAKLPELWRATYPQPEKAQGQSDADYDATTPAGYGDEVKRAIRYLRQVRRWLTVFAEWCALEGLVYVDELNATTHGKAFLAAQVKKHCGTTKSFSNLVVMMRGVFTRLRRAEHVSVNPFLDAKTGGEKDSVHRRSFSAEDVERIIAAAENMDPELALALQVAVGTGLRKIDCCRMLRGSVRLDEGVLALTPAKKGDPVRIPIHPPLRKVLETALCTAGPLPSDPLFKGLSDLYAQNPDNITDRLRAILKSVGFGDADVRLPRGNRIRRPSVRDFASLRTSFVTWGIKGGMLDADLAKITGHATVKLIRANYYQPGDRHLRSETAQKLPAFVTGINAPTPTAVAADLAGDPVQAFLDALDFCGPADVAALRPTLRSLAAALPLPTAQRERINKGVGALQPSNLDAMRPRLAAAAKGQS